MGGAARTQQLLDAVAGARSLSHVTGLRVGWWSPDGVGLGVLQPAAAAQGACHLEALSVRIGIAQTGALSDATWWWILGGVNLARYVLSFYLHPPYPARVSADYLPGQSFPAKPVTTCVSGIVNLERYAEDSAGIWATVGLPRLRTCRRFCLRTNIPVRCDVREWRTAHTPPTTRWWALPAGHGCRGHEVGCAALRPGPRTVLLRPQPESRCLEQAGCRAAVDGRTTAARSRSASRTGRTTPRRASRR